VHVLNIDEVSIAVRCRRQSSLSKQWLAVVDTHLDVHIPGSFTNLKQAA